MLDLDHQASAEAAKDLEKIDGVLKVRVIK